MGTNESRFSQTNCKKWLAEQVRRINRGRGRRVSQCQFATVESHSSRCSGDSGYDAYDGDTDTKQCYRCVASGLLNRSWQAVRENDVTELPETIYRDIGIIIPKKLRDKYEHLKNESILELDNGELINAVHAGSRTQKLLQTLSGAVYDEEGVAQDLHPERHALVLDLVEETDHCLVAFNWTHQRNGLVAMAKSRKLSYAVIDGSVPAGARAKIVERFQNGELRVIFAHPQSAGHGLTLTKANRIIWSSPTYRADLYEQFNHRIIRTGQRRKTEVIHLSGVDTAEEIVYQKLGTKTARMRDLLETLTELNKAA